MKAQRRTNFRNNSACNFSAPREFREYLLPLAPREVLGASRLGRRRDRSSQTVIASVHLLCICDRSPPAIAPVTVSSPPSIDSLHLRLGGPTTHDLLSKKNVLSVKCNWISFFLIGSFTSVMNIMRLFLAIVALVRVRSQQQQLCHLAQTLTKSSSNSISVCTAKACTSGLQCVQGICVNYSSLSIEIGTSLATARAVGPK